MTKFANIVTVEVRPDDVDYVLTALTAHKERSLSEEPGTLQFEILRPNGETSRLLTYEVYEDEAAFDRHRKAPSLARWLSETTAMVVSLSGTRCSLLD
jgi:quinol monooxygenase YgiN